jgi:hypothetical protein
MRPAVLLAIGLIGMAHVSYGEQPLFDRDLAVAAAQPYVEAYLRWHPVRNAGPFDWNHAQVVFVRGPESSTTKGYVGVFFPETEGSGAGFTCFTVWGLLPDRIGPAVWGYLPSLTDAIEKFRRSAADGHIDLILGGSP